MKRLEQHSCEAESCEVKQIHEEHVAASREQMPKEDILIDMAEFFKMLGDSTRIRIIYALKAGELCVCDLAAVLGMTSTAVSHQLRLLKQTDLVRSRREGKVVYYSLADGHVQQIAALGYDHITEDD